jgi:hypothetical protein
MREVVTNNSESQRCLHLHCRVIEQAVNDLDKKHFRLEAAIFLYHQSGLSFEFLRDFDVLTSTHLRKLKEMAVQVLIDCHLNRQVFNKDLVRENINLSVLAA